MGYLVLARKYRPGSFGDVVGQEAAVRTLRNALAQNRIAHAYLFTGPRGVGKTSLARILARGLRCEKGPTPDPCGECERCRGISAGRDLDVVEIDGASNRGIENIRDLRESVRYAPTSGRFKVYIVDEVHQITQDAFNAFLKTLEEPPAHVVFVFATTEPSKVPETIRSRCQVFEFRRVSEAAIAAHVRDICKAEQLELEAGMDLEVARRARGGLRDALSLLDQLAAYGAGTVGFEAFRELTGFLAPDRVRELVQHVIEGDAAAALQWVGDALDRGSSAGDLADQLLEYLRALLHRKAGSDRAPELPGVDEEAVAAQVSALDESQLLGALQVLADGRRHLRELDDVRLALEMVVLELVHLSELPALADVLARWGAEPAPRARRSPASAPRPRRTSPGGGAAAAAAPAREPTPAELRSETPPRSEVMQPAEEPELGPRPDLPPAPEPPAHSEPEPAHVATSPSPETSERPTSPQHPATSESATSPQSSETSESAMSLRSSTSSERPATSENASSLQSPTSSLQSPPSTESPGAERDAAPMEETSPASRSSLDRPGSPAGVAFPEPPEAPAPATAPAPPAPRSEPLAPEHASLDAPPFPPELELEAPEESTEPEIVQAPLPPLPPAPEVFQRLLSALREQQPSNWAILERIQPVEIEDDTLWLEIDDGSKLDRARLDPWVRDRAREWYGRPLSIRAQQHRRERPAEDLEFRSRLDLLQDRFGGGLVRE